ncbi:MAG: phosphonate C-P lyase system protein PhnG [Rhodobacterales bacterium]|nr:phosphonate C-P lyase system protein PhnG [Rhodobacterales bacterium]NCT12766.1 phosphonate C-P lyase system protein PhnG [Rhodobacterales bacterium]
MDGKATAQTDRQHWLGLLARAPAGRLDALCRAAQVPRAGTWLRRAEIGTVMLRGRAGGTGAPFNLGEITVTRAAVELPGGTVGHGHVQGRDKAAAEWAALVDALMQTDAAGRLRPAILDPIAAELAATAADRAARAAATRVEFFTLVRGED